MGHPDMVADMSDQRGLGPGITTARGADEILEAQDESIAVLAPIPDAGKTLPKRQNRYARWVRPAASEHKRKRRSFDPSLLGLPGTATTSFRSPVCAYST